MTTTVMTTVHLVVAATAVAQKKVDQTSAITDLRSTARARRAAHVRSTAPARRAAHARSTALARRVAHARSTAPARSTAHARSTAPARSTAQRRVAAHASTALSSTARSASSPIRTDNRKRQVVVRLICESWRRFPKEFPPVFLRSRLSHVFDSALLLVAIRSVVTFFWESRMSDVATNRSQKGTVAETRRMI